MGNCQAGQRCATKETRPWEGNEVSRCHFLNRGLASGVRGDVKPATASGLAMIRRSLPVSFNELLALPDKKALVNVDESRTALSLLAVKRSFVESPECRLARQSRRSAVYPTPNRLELLARSHDVRSRFHHSSVNWNAALKRLYQFKRYCCSAERTSSHTSLH